jgi:3',5'-cyclic-AMP phosphodiesterase
VIIAQLSDPHIAEGRPGPSDHLSRAVAHLLALPARPDLVIVTGDCVENGLPSEYEQFQALLRPLPMPVYVIAGNHDHRPNLLTAFGTQGNAPLEGFVQYVVDDWAIRIIALDTLIPGRGAGELCETRLAWLGERLEEQPTKPTMIMMHHPPFRVAIGAFEAIIAEHGQVERIVAGHIHAVATRRVAGTVAMTCSAMWQDLMFDFGTPGQLRAQMQPPSCFVHVWDDHMGFVTHTSIIGEYEEPVLIHDGTRWV